MFSSSLRLGGTSLRLGRTALDKFSSRTVARASKSTSAHQSKPPGPALAIAAGFSALLIGGLDFVAPGYYPFQDEAAGTTATTYWNDKDANPRTNNDTTTIQRRSPPATGHQNYRVVIVGGGMAGLHTALALAERIKQQGEILVLDANQIGQSASGRSKGLAVPGIQVEQEGLARICGSEQLAEKIYEMTYKAAERLEKDIVQKYNIDCHWVHSGHVEASLHEDEDDEEEEDEDCRPLTASQVRTLLGQPESSTLYKGGELDTTCCGVDPLALTKGLAHVLENQWGVKIQEQTKVSKIEKIEESPTTTGDSARNARPMKYALTTETGAQIQCQHVVLCTGPELVSKELSQKLQHAIIPIYTWMASTVPLGDKCPLQNGVTEDLLDNKKGKTSVRPAPMCGDDFVCLNYWRRTQDGRLLFGSLADAYPVPKWLAEYRLRKAMVQVYPQLSDVPFQHVWGGRLAFPRDAVPLIGRDEGLDHASDAKDPSKSGVWYATGFGGHGIIPTVMAGSILAGAILGRDDQTWRIFQREFPPHYTFWPVSQLGAQALLTLYNVVDWLHVKGVPVPQLPKPW